MVAALAALLIAAAPAPSSPTAEQCDQLWDETVGAAAPDLTPTDELRRSFLLKEKAQLARRCAASSLEILHCPQKATAQCIAPVDGGSVVGLARCVYPAVQECVQVDRLARSRSDGSLDRLLARLASGELKPEKGVIKLPAEQSDLSLGGIALAEGAAPHVDAVLLVFNERNTNLRGILVSSDPARFVPSGKPPPELKVGGVRFMVLRIVDAHSAEVQSISR